MATEPTSEHDGAANPSPETAFNTSATPTTPQRRASAANTQQHYQQDYPTSKNTAPNSTSTARRTFEVRDAQGRARFAFGAGESVWQNHVWGMPLDDSGQFVTLDQLLDCERCTRALFTTMAFDPNYLDCMLPHCRDVLVVKVSF